MDKSKLLLLVIEFYIITYNVEEDAGALLAINNVILSNYKVGCDNNMINLSELYINYIDYKELKKHIQ